MITKAEAVNAYAGSRTALARALKIKPQAVYQWPDEGPIPEVHELRLRYELKPEFFRQGQPQAPAIDAPHCAVAGATQ